MYCPKCGGEALENQRFCKSCGTNLQMIYDALDGGDSAKGPFGIDVDALTRNAQKFAESWKAGWNGVTTGHEYRRSTRPVEDRPERARFQPVQPPQPKPKEWLSYSWQHNLRNGLISLFGGLGLGAVLYYLGMVAINEGTISSLQEFARRPINGAERLVGLAWLFALIPVLKGIAQIFYAAFFAESIASLTEKFVPRQAAIQEPAPPNYERLSEPPSSVTEHTTHIFEEKERN